MQVCGENMRQLQCSLNKSNAQMFILFLKNPNTCQIWLKNSNWPMTVIVYKKKLKVSGGVVYENLNCPAKFGKCQ